MLFEVFAGLLIGFACGYGARSYVSRRRREAIRKKEELEFETQTLSQQEQIEHLKFMATLSAPIQKQSKW
jgi:hypothetical protein